MTTYWGRNYRRNYERYYNCCLLNHIDVHHIDGNHNNNHPLNLQAVTLQEHYDIHKTQNDHYACVMIALRMSIKPLDWKEMARINGAKSGTPELRSKWGKKGGKTMYEKKLGIYAATQDQRIEWSSNGGKKTSELGLGFKAGHASAAGAIGGKLGGAWAKKNRTGIFALSAEKEIQRLYNFECHQAIGCGRASAYPRSSEPKKYTFTNIETGQKLLCTPFELAFRLDIKVYRITNIVSDPKTSSGRPKTTLGWTLDLESI